MATGTVTILFTDLVDSTATLSRLGEQAGEELRLTHFALLRAPLADFNGTEVKNLGDGLMLVFGGVADAVACAAAMQQRVEQHNRNADTPLGIRMGIAVGDATEEDGDYFGTPVVESARLCAKAASGQILVTDLVRMLGGAQGAQFAAVGALELKGLPEPVTAHEVVWEPSEAVVDVPLPPALRLEHQLRLFGRGVEQEQLGAARKRAESGLLTVVLLAGEPGIGKTRLATELANGAFDEGTVVLFGRCDEDVGFPYQPFVEALRHFVTHAPDAALGGHSASHGGVLARLVPELALRVPGMAPPPSGDSESERYLLFDAMVDLLGVAAAPSGLVLVLDDLHWADKPTLLLLKHLATTRPDLGVLVIGTYRDTDIGRSHPLTSLLADFRRVEGVERIALSGLSDVEVVAYLTAMAGHDLDDDGVALAHAIRRETEGSPFFVIETMRHLRDSGAVFHEDGRWTYRGQITDLGIPDSVREVVGRRLERLSDEVNKILTTASVIGPGFDLDLLVRLVGVDEDEVLDGLEEATSAALVAEVTGATGQFRFAHGLVRHTLYDELSATRRARLHRRVAEALEELQDEGGEARLTELSHHWFEATKLADVPKAIEYARRAGDRALDDLAYEEAARQYSRALDVLEPTDDEGRTLGCDLLLALGDAQRRSADAAFRATFVDAFAIAADLASAERMVLAALGTMRPGAWYVAGGQVDQEGLAMFEAAVAILPPDDTAIRARALAGLAVELAFTPQEERRRELCDEAERIVRSLGDPAALGQLLAARFLSQWDPFTLGDRTRIAEELISLGEAERQPWFRLQGHLCVAFCRLEAGDEVGLVTDLDRAETLAEELRTPFYRWLVAMSRAALQLVRAPDAAAEAEVAAVSQLGEENFQLDTMLALSGQLFSLYWDRGALGDLVDTARQFAADLPAQPVWRAAVAIALLHAGRRDEVGKALDEAAAAGFALPRDYTWAGVVGWVEIAAELGRDDVAPALISLIEPFRDQVVVIATCTLCRGAFARYLAMAKSLAGDHDGAEADFRHALDIEGRLDLRTQIVHTQRWYADLLVRRAQGDDVERATAMVVEAREAAVALGMARLEQQLDDLHATIELLS